MKNAALFLLTIFLVSCAKDSETTYSTSADNAFLSITRNTTESELVKIAAQFKLDRNISIDFSDSEFGENGKIQNLKLEVDCNDGYNGHVKVSGAALQLKNSGFRRDYSENAEQAFSIGVI